MLFGNDVLGLVFDGIVLGRALEGGGGAECRDAAEVWVQPSTSCSLLPEATILGIFPHLEPSLLRRRKEQICVFSYRGLWGYSHSRLASVRWQLR